MWDEAEINTISDTFPGLGKVSPNTVGGRLSFKASFETGRLILNPSFDAETSSESVRNFIADSYEIEITWSDGLPTLRETSGRIINFANENGVDPPDLHINGDGTACLCSEPQLRRSVRNEITPQAYVQDLAIPFFYGQSFFQRFGRWPWRQLGHGPWGNIEWLGLVENPTEEDVRSALRSLRAPKHILLRTLRERSRRHLPCPCGSGRKIAKCHPLVPRGIQVLKSWIDIDKLEQP